MDKYIGLLKADGSEPRPESGYRRVPEAEIVFFPDSVGEGYGVVCAVGYFTSPEDGAPTATTALLTPMDCHAGVTPIFKDGRLLRGIAAKAEALCFSGGNCSIKEVSEQ